MTEQRAVYERDDLPRVFRFIAWPSRAITSREITFALILMSASAVLSLGLTLDGGGSRSYVMLGLSLAGAVLTGSLLLWMKTHPREL